MLASERPLEFSRCEMEKLMQLGKEFGLEGEKLLEFVREQQKLEGRREGRKTKVVIKGAEARGRRESRTAKT